MKNSKKFLLTAVSLASCSVFLLDTYFPVFAQDSIDDTQSTTEVPSFVDRFNNYFEQLKVWFSAFNTVIPASKEITEPALAIAYLPSMLIAVCADYLNSKMVGYDNSNLVYYSSLHSSTHDSTFGATFRRGYVTYKNVSSGSLTIFSSGDGVSFWALSFDVDSPLKEVSLSVDDYLSFSPFVNQVYKSSSSTSFTLRGNGSTSDDQFVSYSSVWRLYWQSTNDNLGGYYPPSDFPLVSIPASDINSLSPDAIAPYVVNKYEAVFPTIVNDPGWRDVVDNLPEYPQPGDYYDIKDPLLPALPNANTLPTLPAIDPSDSSVIQPMLQGSKTLFGLIGNFIKDSGLLPWILIIVVCSIAWFFLRW